MFRSPRARARGAQGFSAALLAGSLVACAHPGAAPAREPIPLARAASVEVPSIARERDVPAPDATRAPTPALVLPLGERRIELPAGRSLVDVTIPAGHTVSLGVFGPVDALLDFDLVDAEDAGVASYVPLDEDGRLPRVVSFRAPQGVERVRVVVDVAEPVALERVDAELARAPAPNARALRFGVEQPRSLVGIPAPLSRDDGYLLGSPARYLFARVDVAALLLSALRQVRVRFRRDPIAIGDISQWNGVRPATDLGHPRHISHEGGRDLDIALPANDDEPSILRPHCTGVLVDSDHYVCEPGTEHGVDMLRLAYLLGLLVDGSEGHVVKIFTDDAYIREIHRANEELKARRWIKDLGYAALGEDGVLRASPWHVDHVHVRFSGEPGKPLW